MLNVLGKYGFEPQLVATVLRKYHAFLGRHFAQNTKKFLFFGRKNMKPIAYEGMKTRLQTAMTNLVEKPLGGQELRTFFVSCLNEQAVPIQDRRIIADTIDVPRCSVVLDGQGYGVQIIKCRKNIGCVTSNR